MKREKNSLDHFLHERVEDTQFAFKEEYWDQMVELLDKEEKDKKRPFFWRWFSLLGLLVITGIATYLYSKGNSTNSNKENNYAPVENNQTNTNNNIKTEEHNDDNTVEFNAKNNENQPKNNESIAETKQVNVAKENLNVEVKNPETNNNIVENNINSAENASAVNDNNNTSVAEPIKKEATKKHKIVLAEKSTSTKKKFLNKKERVPFAKNREVTTEKKNIANKKDDKTNGILNTTNTQKIDNKLTETNKETVGKTVLTEEGAPKSVMIHGKQMIAKDTIIYSTRIARDETVYNPRYNAALKNYVPEKYDSVTILTFKPVKENVETIQEAKKLKKEKEPFEAQPMNLLLAFGANMNKGFAGNINNPTQWGISPYIGVGIEKQFSHRLSMASQVGFTYFNGLNMKKTISNNQFSFGLDSSSVAVYNKTMYQLYLPIHVYYQLLKNHSVFAGVGATYSLNVSSTYEEVIGKNNGFNTTTNTTNKTFTTTTNDNQLGYSNGFNNLDVFFQAGYSYQLFRTIAIQVGLQQGLFDATKNSYFNNNIKNTQTRFSLGIKYSFKRNND